MPFPPHYLLQWGGDFVSEPNEIWSNTIRFATGEGTESSEVSMSTAQQQAAAQGLLGVIVSGLPANSNGIMSSNVRVKYAKFNRIGPDGRYTNAGATSVAFQSGAGAPGGGVSTHPVTAALVVTWRPLKTRGPASRGRIFVPQPTVATGSPTYRIPASSTQFIADNYRAFLNQCNSTVAAAGGVGLKACVVSSIGDNGVSERIDRVEVGDILDYMGSRRNNLQEVRSQSAPVT